ncbi:MAG: cytochrome P450 [Myxococcales bacterium]|nr:cytochrome P450 [Myxococcales bacterium]
MHPCPSASPRPCATPRSAVSISPGHLGGRVSYLLHRLPSIWPDPERVDPERFLTTPAPGTWLPFLMGPHTCLGMRLAMMELPLVAARLLHAFELTLPGKGLRSRTSVCRSTRRACWSARCPGPREPWRLRRRDAEACVDVGPRREIPVRPRAGTW